MEHLRVLDLGGVRLYGVPESIAHLKHLRYLCISGLFKELPKFVGSICHIQTLDLGGVSELPNSMSNLLNLRHLRGRDIIEYPVGIGKLAELQTMPGFHVSPKHNHAKLGELKYMNNIRGVFAISGLENLADVSEAKKACLDKKRNISSLRLEWDPRAASSSIDEEVLESLKPSVKLVGLQISGFKGPSYPSWLVDQSFFRLGTIELELCEKWISLPPLGQLPSLKSLYISNARAVEYIGREFFSGGFPRLEELTLGYLYNWKSWCGAQERDCPKLKKLSIERCGNLESFSLINLGALEDMSISRCPKLRCVPGHSLELSHLPCLQTIKIQDIYKVRLIDASFFSPAAPLGNQPCLELEDVGQREVEYILGMCSHIYQLTVRRCLNLTSLRLGNLSALEYLAITECPELQITSISPQLWQLPSLQRINVNGIHGAESIKVVWESHMELTQVNQLVASSLKEFSLMIRQLVITNCANLTSLPLMDHTALEYLEIRDCNQLQLSSGSFQLPQSMCEMKVKCIRGAEYIHGLFSPGGVEALGTSCLEFTNVDQSEASFLLHEFSHMIRRLIVTQCANLTSLPLAELTTMEYLEISRCNQLQLSSGSLQLPQSSSMWEMVVKYIRGAEYIRALFFPGGTETQDTSCLELANVDLLEASFMLHELCHMIRRLSITRCANLTSLPWADLSALEYLRISECPLFQLLDAEQLPPTLQVLCIYGNPYEREQCSRHPHFQRLKQVQQCSNKEGGDCNLYLVFRNVHDASEAASNFCHDASEAASNSRPKIYREIHTWEIEWDCCTNDRSNFVDSVAEEVLGKLYHSLAALWNIRNLNKLVIRGHKGSRFASSRWHPFFYSLSSVSLIQCSKCEILPPLSQLNSLEELFVEGASTLESFMQDHDNMSEEGWQETQSPIAFPRLQKLEFHDMPVWKEWLGTKEGDFPLLRKLILKHCPRLMALPHLPPSLEELELEACHELTSLSIFDSPDHTKSFISLNPLTWSQTRGTRRKAGASYAR
ncbi:hypothetical protein Taro_040906 [Colocasia esculenta]|uniref:R13L1/DRL21-like LRR repeat region domain-containing protein n=1 Tax=Colocasia esculenta TaxID=4460 RepID=A0A843WD05_COLES|nr:hypothetical protein [Colocasia esculenta]